MRKLLVGFVGVLSLTVFVGGWASAASQSAGACSCLNHRLGNDETVDCRIERNAQGEIVRRTCVVRGDNDHGKGHGKKHAGANDSDDRKQNKKDKREERREERQDRRDDRKGGGGGGIWGDWDSYL